jgi:hypothetical protein
MSFRRSFRELQGVVAYCCLLFVLNAGIAISIRHVFRASRYSAVGSMRELLLWALAANLASAALLVGFLHISQLNRRLLRIIALDVLISLFPLLMIRCLRIHGAEKRLELFGLTYTAAVFLRCFAFSYYSLIIAKDSKKPSIPLRAWVFLVSLIVYASFTPWVASAWPTGDEPHYLLLTHSLVVDRDLDMANNYRQDDAKSFYPGGLGEYHHSIKNNQGQELPIHDVGLSVLLIPGYGLGGRIGAMLDVNVVAALLALGIFEFAVTSGANPTQSLFCWALFAFTTPVIVYASQVYPEIIGAAGVLWAIISFSRFLTNQRILWLLAAGSLLALLPWFSVRYWMIAGPFMAVVALYLLFDVKALNWGKRLQALCALSVPMLASLGLFAIFDKHYYNILLPNAGYVLHVSAMKIPMFTHQPQIGLLGMFVDRAYGLLPIAPVYILVMLGAWQLVTSWRPENVVILVTSIVYVLFMAFSRYWYGGWCPAGRFLVPLVGLWAPLAISIFAHRRGRWLAFALSTWSLAIAFVQTAFPGTRYSAPPDFTESSLTVFFRQHVGADAISNLFPSIMRGGYVDFAKAAAWITVLIICAWLFYRFPEESLPPDSRFHRDGYPGHSAVEFDHRVQP